MPNYVENEFKESNVNYLNKDFTSFKQSLVEYAKSYFPETYRDFNETSPGMMLIEMSAYVGDVLSFYIDRQYQEMMLPLAEERRNIINMAKMFGYKHKPIVAAHADVTFTSTVNAITDDRSKVDYSHGSVFEKGIQISATTDGSLIFETLDIIDFTVTQSGDTSLVAVTEEDTGLISSYTLSRTVKAVSGKGVSQTFNITSPEKFLKITLEDKNVIDILSVIDSNGNKWYEVDFLAQDKVVLPTHYTNDPNRDSAYHNINGQLFETDVPVPYSLEYKRTQKRFTRETNLDGSTSLIFGNGILKNGTNYDSDFLDLEQVGIVIPGQINDLNEAIDPLLGDEYSTLGEAPAHMNLTVNYRIGGGVGSNVPAGELTNYDNNTITKLKDGGSNIVTSTNTLPAIGGRNRETTEEIREKTKAFFSTQNRAVTKEDYEARVLNIPARYGNIAKVYVQRFAKNEYINPSLEPIQDYINQNDTIITELNELVFGDYPAEDIVAVTQTILNNYNSNIEIPNLSELSYSMGYLPSVNIFILAYDRSKRLVGNPNASLIADASDDIPTILKQNISSYLENFRLLTDEVLIEDGYIINFGIFFDVVAHKYANKQQVKILCIELIKDYFRIEKMKFNQPISISQLEYILMDIEGVRSVTYVRLSQYENKDPLTGDTLGTLTDKTYKYSIESDGSINQGGTTGYGYAYNFEAALVEGMILPPSPNNPGVFELKNPNQNIVGVVR